MVAFEAHHDVFERTGVDPCEVLRYLAGIRPVGHLVAERRELALDPARPFFEQVQSPRIANLVCWSLQAP